MKSFWIFSATSRPRLGALVVLSALAGMAVGEVPSEELVNFALGPGLSHWLVGAVSTIAERDEVEAYLELRDDADAVAFIDAFWERRGDPEIPWPEQQPRAIFERRAAEADRLFTEGITLGRRTDRGEVFVLYGPPAETRYEVDERTGEALEIWEYEKDSGKGLDGERPRVRYYFVESGGRTIRR